MFLILSDCDMTLWCGMMGGDYKCCKGNESLIESIENTLAQNDDAELWLWSGGGKRHAQNCAKALGLRARCFSKPDKWPMTKEAALAVLGRLPDVQYDDDPGEAIPDVEFHLIHDYDPHGMQLKRGLWLPEGAE